MNEIISKMQFLTNNRRVVMETVLRTQENMKKCLCSECPSYTTKCKIKNYPINMMKLVEGLENIDHFEKMF